MRRHELTDEEWAIIAPLLPNKVRGVVRVDDRRVINGILWRVSGRGAVAGCAGALWSAHNPLQPFRSLAGGRGLGQAVGSGLRRL